MLVKAKGELGEVGVYFAAQDKSDPLNSVCGIAFIAQDGRVWKSEGSVRNGAFLDMLPAVLEALASAMRTEPAGMVLPR